MDGLRVSVFGFNNKLEYGKLGEIVWNGRRIVTKPRGNLELQSILGPYCLVERGGVRELHPEKEPKEWIQNLYRRYMSAQIRVHRAIEIKAQEGGGRTPRRMWRNLRFD